MAQYNERDCVISGYEIRCSATEQKRIPWGKNVLKLKCS